MLRGKARESTLRTERFGLDNGILNEMEGLKLYEFDEKPSLTRNASGAVVANAPDQDINRYSYLFTLLQKLEAQKLDKSIFLKPNDPGMILITKKIEKLKESLTKPKEVLIKYNELLRISRGQDALLRLLEQQYETVKLEQSKISKPWRILSQPKLKERPVGPKRLQFIFLSFMASTFLPYLSYKI